MKKKQIKVTKGCTKDHTPVPKITMQGHWLNELGFSIGDNLAVVYNENQIIILKHAESGAVWNNSIVAEPSLKYGRRGGDNNGGNNLLLM